MPSLSVEELDRIQTALEKDGYYVIRGLMNSDVLDEAERELNKLVDTIARQQKEANLTDSLFAEEPFDKRLAKIFEGRWNDVPKIFRTELHLSGMYNILFNQDLVDIAQHVLGTEEIRLYPNYTCRPKVPGATEKHTVLWHQDAGYTQSKSWHALNDYTDEQLRSALMCVMNVWIPLVDATVQNGCMQFIPGSHTTGVQKHLEKKEYLELDPDVMAKCLDKAVDIEAKRGDVVLFGQYLYHCGLPNVSDTIRWTFDFRYQDAVASTLRHEPGHMARSALHPEKVVRDGQHWAQLELGGKNPK